MARNRQRAKERQARRKSGTGGSPPSADSPRREPAPKAAPDSSVARDEAARDDEQVPDEVSLQAGAPPEDLGSSAETLDDEPDLDDDEHFNRADDHPEEDLVSTASGPTGHRGDLEADHKDRPRLVQFLIAVRAELARVRWPDRQALTTLTGVVLGFVVLAGGYLGLLDAIFSRLIQAIL